MSMPSAPFLSAWFFLKRLPVEPSKLWIPSSVLFSILLSVMKLASTLNSSMPMRFCFRSLCSKWRPVELNGSKPAVPFFSSLLWR